MLGHLKDSMRRRKDPNQAAMVLAPGARGEAFRRPVRRAVTPDGAWT